MPQTFSDILEDLGRKTLGLYCLLCQKSFSRKWNRNQCKKYHCDTVSELKKEIAAAIAEASTVSEEAETPPERAVLTPFLVNRRPCPILNSTDESEHGGMPDLSYQRQVEQAQEQVAVPRSTRAIKRAKKVTWARSVSQPAALSGDIASEPEASEEEVEA